MGTRAEGGGSGNQRGGGSGNQSRGVGVVGTRAEGWG